MTRGITITSYLATGDPEGIIFTYMSNWSGQAIKIPRNLFPESKDFMELKRPGLYFLIGQNEENPDDKMVYVGEANILFQRISEHLRDNEKSFAEVIVCFCSKDENLTVSHTKYLEYKTILQLYNTREYRLINRKDGTEVNLPKMVKDEMETFFENIKIILPTLGYSMLHEEKTEALMSSNRDQLFYLDMSGCKATAKLTSTGLEVQPGSQMKQEETTSLSPGYLNLRKTLIKNSIVVQQNDKYHFAQSYEFPSPSTAAAIILGYPANGRTAWRTQNGKSLKQLEEEQIENIL